MSQEQQDLRRSQRRRSHVDHFDPMKEATRPQLKTTASKPRQRKTSTKVNNDHEEILTPRRKRRSKSPAVNRKAVPSEQKAKSQPKQERQRRVKQEELVSHAEQEAKTNWKEAAKIEDQHMKKEKQASADSKVVESETSTKETEEFDISWDDIKLATSNCVLSIFAQNMASLCWRARLFGPVVLLVSIATGALISALWFVTKTYMHDLHTSVQSFNEFIAPPILAVNFLSKSGSEFQVLESCMFASSIFVNLYLATKLYAPSRLRSILLVFKATSAILIFYSEWFSSLKSRYFGTVGVLTGIVGEFFCTYESNRSEWMYVLSALALVLCASPFNFKRESLDLNDIISSNFQGV